jgi:AcrR family transcriptional regulator
MRTKLCYRPGMSRKRLTREETREQTTQRLLDAAEKVIAREGLDAASVEEICAAAGYTRGAFYSNFGSKEDLFIELLRRDHQQRAADFAALCDDALPLEELEARLIAEYSALYRDNECFMNWTEARLLAVRDPRFRAKLSGLIAEKRAQIGGLIRYFYGRMGVEPPVPPEELAFGFMSLVEGVKLANLASPAEISPEATESVLALFLRSIIAAARAQPRK